MKTRNAALAIATRTLPIALLVTACVAPVTSEQEQAIIGGELAQPSEFPTVVALENTPGNWGCTGSLIDKAWVLSAAHCVVGETPASLKIRFDDGNVNDTTGGRVVAVAEIHAHPSFVDTAWDNDIALIKLAEPVTDRAPTVIHRPTVPPATMLIEVGYGDSDANNNGAGILRKVTVPTVDCAMANDPEISNTNLLCFDPTTGKTSCYGDSGGPAFIPVGGKLEVAGISSGGTGNTCIMGWDLFTSVAGEIAFVDMYLGTTSEPDPTPDPDPNNPDGADADAGCCTASGGSTSLVFAAAFLLFVVRRRRRFRSAESRSRGPAH